jgi:outer membrane protein assembly factor BamB
MAWTRTTAALATAAATIVTLTGLAGPAHATYDPQPITLPWHPAGPVHASTQRSGVVYLGGILDGTGGIAAINASSGSLLWMVPADGDVRALTLSDDGSTLYAGGKFSTVGGATHRRLVALNVADHTVRSSPPPGSVTRPSTPSPTTTSSGWRSTATS